MRPRGKANESQSNLVKKMHSCQRSGANDLQDMGARQDAGEQEARHQWEVNTGKESSNLAGSKGDQAEDQKGSHKLRIHMHTFSLSDWVDARGGRRPSAARGRVDGVAVGAENLCVIRASLKKVNSYMYILPCPGFAVRASQESFVNSSSHRWLTDRKIRVAAGL